MLANYLKIAFRSLRRQAGYAAINLFGLSVGLACCLLILLFVRDELGFDRFHEKAGRIYRLERESLQAGNRGRFSFTDGVMGPSLAAEYPEVEAAVRLARTEHLVRAGEHQQYGARIAFADDTFFRVFSFRLLEGDAATALTHPYSLVLTQSMARTYFGDESPVGKTVRLDNTDDYTVTGVVADVPHNSHYRFDALGSFSTLPPKMPWLDQRGAISLQTYVLLQAGMPRPVLEAKLPDYVAKYYRDAQEVIHLRPLTDIHLYSDVYELEQQGDIKAVYLFSTIALFILLLACINYMNLATARAARRMKEVGMRKVMGAGRPQLVLQFVGESVLLALLALAGALVLVAALRPALEAFLGRVLPLADAAADPLLLAGLVGLCLLVGVVAGTYPAFYLTRFQPVAVLKGTGGGARGGSWLRQTLVVAQFVVSIALLAATAIVYDQLRFMQAKDLGFDREHVVDVQVRDAALLERMDLLQQRLRQDPHVVSASVSSSGVGEFLRSTMVGREDADAATPGAMTGFLFTDPAFVPTMGMTMAAGRNFSRERADAATDVLITEAAAKAYGWANPADAVGQRLVSNGFVDGPMTVLGVVRDFHVRSLRSPVVPMLLLNTRLPDDAVLSVRLQAGDVRAALGGLEAAWRSVVPEWPFEYTFVDAQVAQRLARDRQTGELFGVFAGLAIVIACLGLFGLAAYMAEQRTKEIGVRKVMGASVPQIVVLLSRDFTRLVLLAFILAAPTAYVLMRSWLSDFAYRVELGPGVFAFAGLTALAIAFLTVSYQSIKAALSDPVKALRYE